MKCQECNTELVSGTHSVVTKVGSFDVECNATYDLCSCGYSEIDTINAELLELRAVQIVLQEAKIDGAILKFARKAIGLTKEALAEKFELSESTIDQFENDLLPPPSVYVLVLTGLLIHAERSLLGQNIGYIKK